MSGILVIGGGAIGRLTARELLLTIMGRVKPPRRQ
jgi:hypothetical protein